MPPQIPASQPPTQYATADHDKRASAQYSPSIWGDVFLSYGSTETAKMKDEQRVQVLKEKVRRMLIAPVKKFSQKLGLIDDIQRLGVSYHFEKEIGEILLKIHEDSYECDDLENDMDDLYTAALSFRLLRQQGYNVSCDKFDKFRDGDGKFKATLINDVLGLLGLYEATHLRMKGEDALDEALAFTSSNLEHYLAAAQFLNPPCQLSKQVTHALYQPLWKGIPRLEVRHYLSIYEAHDSHDESLLTFAKLDFNLLQQVHQKELSEITKWWRDLDFANKLPFARNRVVESYFWAVAVYYQPEYYLGRRILCQAVAMITIIDDIYDVHGTLEEVELFTQAVDRWDISAMNTLPEYMQICYQALLDVYSEFEEELAKEGNLYGIYYARESMKVIVRGYFQEAKWFHQKYIPTTEEHMPVALATSLYMLTITCIVGMGAIATKDSLEWLFNDPKIVHAASINGRLKNDMISYQFGEKRGDAASAVECYIKQYGVSGEKAIVELSKQVDNAWKDINEGWLNCPITIPMPLLLRVLNQARFVEILYKHGDGFTHAGIVLKDHIASLFTEPVLI